MPGVAPATTSRRPYPRRVQIWWSCRAPRRGPRLSAAGLAPSAQVPGPESSRRRKGRPPLDVCAGDPRGWPGRGWWWKPSSRRGRNARATLVTVCAVQPRRTAISSRYRAFEAARTIRHRGASVWASSAVRLASSTSRSSSFSAVSAACPATNPPIVRCASDDFDADGDTPADKRLRPPGGCKVRKECITRDSHLG